jgi:DMSO/TMAO reductase YedYZ molybdopterin-dependent catalytic subunit
MSAAATGAVPSNDAVEIPFLDAQASGRGLRWDELREWITPAEKVFAVSHYGTPKVNVEDWHLEISGLVNKSRLFSLAEIKARKRRSVIATLECSGNGSSPNFVGAVGNMVWTGTPLGPLLKECGLHHRAIEAVFYGADQKTEKIREKDYEQNFGRSLGLNDALAKDVLLAYEMNGQPLGKEHGAPLRLIVPGWFGIAWVKWLTRIELLDRRFMNKFMARDYVTIRGQEHDGKTNWRETSVGPIDVKSVIARAARRPEGTVRFSGVAWTDGTPLKRVEIKIDDQPWRPARIQSHSRSHSPYAWSFFDCDWPNPAAGEHTVVSRATDTEGRAQPSVEDPEIKLKRTYWEANQQWVRRIMI